VEPRACSHPVGPTFYSPNLALLYVWYDALSRTYTGWTLTEIKQMPYRERQFWLDLMKWRSDKSA